MGRSRLRGIQELRNHPLRPYVLTAGRDDNQKGAAWRGENKIEESSAAPLRPNHRQGMTIRRAQRGEGKTKIEESSAAPLLPYHR